MNRLLKQSIVTIYCCFILSQSDSFSQTTFNVLNAGSLKEMLVEPVAQITRLKLTGTLNGDDFNYLKKCTKLHYLDVSDIEIVEGGDYVRSTTWSTVVAKTKPNTVCALMFSDLPLLDTLFLPRITKYIEPDAFYNSLKLRKLTIPSSVIFIYSDAFFKTALTSLIIESEFLNVSSAFASCEYLTEFIVNDNNQKFSSHEGVLYNKDKSVLLSFPQRKRTIPFSENIIAIGDSAFFNYSFSSIDTIHIPETVQSIGKYAFAKSKIPFIDLPNGLKSIEIGTFYSSQIQIINLKEGLTTIGEQAFMDSQIKSVKVPGSVKSIKDNGFNNCLSLETVVLLEGIDSIGKNCFSNCTKLSTLAMSNSISYIGEAAFNECSALSGELVIPENVSVIPEKSFYYCKNISGLKLHDNVDSISASAFKGCTGLRSLILPKSISFLGGEAFSNTSINEIQIPDGIIKLNNAFFNCPITNISIGSGTNFLSYTDFTMPGLLSIQVSNENANFSSRDGILYNKTGSVLVCFPRGKKWVKTGFQGVNEIKEYAFSNCSKIDSVYIPENVILGKGLFSYSSISNVTFSERCTAIPDECFAHCSKLSNFIFPKSLKYLGKSSFNFSSLSALNNLDSISEVSYGAFANTLLKNVSLGDNFFKLNSYAFTGCYALEWIVLGRNISYLGSSSLVAKGLDMKSSLLNIYSLNPIEPSWAWHNPFEDWFYSGTLYIPYNAKSSYNGSIWNACTKKELFTLKCDTILYDGKEHLTTATINIPNHTIKLFYNNEDKSPKNAGLYYLNPKISGDKVNVYYEGYHGYPYLIQKVPLTISVNDTSIYYGDNEPVYIKSFKGFVNDENETVITNMPTVSTSITKSSSPGNYNINVLGGEALNYKFKYDSIAVLNIKKAPLTVTAPLLTKKYGENNPTIILQYNGFKNAENIYSLTQNPQPNCATTKYSDVGEYPITILGGFSNNYEFLYKEGSLNILKVEQNIIWNQTLSENYFVDDLIELDAISTVGLNVDYIVSDTTVAIIVVKNGEKLLKCLKEGKITITAYQGGSKNYNASYSTSLNMSIAKKVSDIQSFQQIKCPSVSVDQNKMITIDYIFGFTKIRVITPNGIALYDKAIDKVDHYMIDFSIFGSGLYILQLSDKNKVMNVKFKL